MTLALQLTGISKSFPGGGGAPRRRVLEGVDLSVQRSEAVAILGENGAGKSTLMRIIAGILTADSGEVETNGRIGALIELGAGFHADDNARKNLGHSLELYGLRGEEKVEAIQRAIHFSGLNDEQLGKPLRHYSSGMVARLGFSFVVALEPDILISDEILAVGDDAFQRQCIAWLEGYVSGGGTLLLVSHNIYHVQKLCTRALWLHKGEVRSQGDVHDVCGEYRDYHDGVTSAYTPSLTLSCDGEPVSSPVARGALVEVAGAAGDQVRLSCATGECIVDQKIPASGTVSLDTGRLLPAIYTVELRGSNGSVHARLKVSGESRNFGCVDLARRWQ